MLSFCSSLQGGMLHGGHRREKNQCLGVAVSSLNAVPKWSGFERDRAVTVVPRGRRAICQWTENMGPV